MNSLLAAVNSHGFGRVELRDPKLIKNAKKRFDTDFTD